MRKPISRLFLSVVAVLLSLNLHAEGTNAIQAGSEYYLYHPHYGKLLGQKADGTPGLSAAGQNADAETYVFTAEASATPGYYRLKQKSGGRYLTASTSNSYSVQFQTTASPQDNSLWILRGGDHGSLSSHRSPDLRLGCDAGKESDTYVSVFYDKAAGEQAEWLIVKADGAFDDALRAFCLRELETAVAEGEVMNEQTSYSLSARRNIRNGLNKARAVLDDADARTADQLLEAARTLRTVLAEARNTDARTFLAGADFDVDATYTLQLGGVKFVSPQDSVTMIVRDRTGMGLMAELSADRITIGGHVYETPGDVKEEGMDFRFIFNNGRVTIYRDAEKVVDADILSVPALTTAGTACEWAVLRVGRMPSYMAEIISPSRAVLPGEKQTDSHGNPVRYVACMAGQKLTLIEPVDFHLMQETQPITSSTISLDHEKAWLIFDNTLPSTVSGTMMTALRVKGSQAVRGANARVDVYLNGAVVMPFSEDVKPFAGYTGEAYSGDAVEVGLGAHDLGADCNRFRSFILKRGYMATVASDAGGKGYSRVYVADHSDLLVPVLPQALNRRISSVHVRKWNYVSKKGWCSTNGNSAIATECKKVRATWFYTWSADRSSTQDTEYIPIRQHLYWPSLSQINGHENSTHVLSFNEPEHAEQHTSDKCGCGGVISEWTACTKTPDLQASGMRIGSPAPTDAGWLYNYLGHCDDMSDRCDFVVMHCYWGTNEAPNAASWYNQLKTIYNKTKRPIWITEWNNGASWTTESWPSGYGDKLEKNRKAIKEILNVLDTCSFVERYAIYNWDSYYRAMINTDDGSLLPAGVVYRDNKSTFAYNAAVQFVPIWWTPSLKNVTMKTQMKAAEGQMLFLINNPNGDVTDRMVIQRRLADGSFEDFHEVDDRALLDSTEYAVPVELARIDMDNDEFRLMVTTASGGTTYSATVSAGYLVNPNVQTSTKDAVDGWTCRRSAANGYTKATGDTYFEVWDATPEGEHFDYYQDVEELPEGVYELSAACFNTTDNVAGATVNGHVGLYAQSGGYEYFTPVTEDSEYDPERRQVIGRIVVTDGRLRVGVKNIGPMSARWAGADEFRLRYVGALDEALPEGREAFLNSVREESDARYMALFRWNADNTTADASGVIINADCDRRNSYGWIVDGNIEYATGEGYDGSVTNPYWNKWSASAYTISMEQDFDYLPGGYYTVSAMLRGSTGVPMTLRATVTTVSGAQEEQSVVFTGTGLELPAGSEYVKGWQRVELPELRLTRGARLQVSLKAVNASGSNWFSADHFGLAFRTDPFVGISSVSDTPEILRVTGGEGCLQVTASASASLAVYASSGVLVASRRIEPGTTSIPLSPGLYVVGRQKVVVR